MSLSDPLIQFMGAVHPYDSLTKSELETLADQCTLQETPKGHTIFKAGDDVDSLYIIVTGEIEITDEIAKLRPIVVNVETNSIEKLVASGCGLSEKAHVVDIVAHSESTTRYSYNTEIRLATVSDLEEINV